jgi:hypothetical protein
VAGAESDLRHLTDLFVEARYSGHEIPAAEGGILRASWQRVKSALRGRPHHANEGDA